MAAAKKKELTFEQAKEKLDAIVEKLGAGNLSLDEMVKLYEEGRAVGRDHYHIQFVDVPEFAGFRFGCTGHTG